MGNWVRLYKAFAILTLMLILLIFAGCRMNPEKAVLNLESDNEAVRMEAVETLIQLEEEEMDVLLVGFYKASDLRKEGLIQVVAQMPENKMPYFIDGLSDPNIHSGLVEALAQRGSAIIPYLMERLDPKKKSFTGQFLDSQKDYVSLGVADILVKIGEPSVQPLIDSMLKLSKNMPNIDSQYKSALESLQLRGKILAEIGEPAVIPLVESLKYLKRPDAPNPLIKENKPSVKLPEKEWYSVTDVLAEIGAPAVLPLMETAAETKEANQRYFSYTVLCRIGAEPIVPYINDEREDIRKLAIDTMTACFGEYGFPFILSRLEDKSKEIRQFTLDKILSVGKSGINALQEYYDGNYENIKDSYAQQYFQNNFSDICAEYRSYLSLGKDGSECVFILALYQLNTVQAAEDYLNCGNTVLSNIAEIWANENGYKVVRKPEGTGNVRWGTP